MTALGGTEKIEANDIKDTPPRRGDVPGDPFCRRVIRRRGQYPGELSDHGQQIRDRARGRGVDYRASAASADRKRVGPLVSEVRWHRSPPERPAMSRA